jgi:2,3-bisphosphoglycerate-dependent phosphoglycerate mutase
MAYLILVRHGQSEWNSLGKWTGWTDVPLSEEGKKQAREAAKALENMDIHKAYTSGLKRVRQTLDEIVGHLKLDVDTVHHPALIERHYGDYTGMNKWEAKEQMGDEDFTKLRRSWDHPVPGGETLKDVHARAVPFYKQHILADLKQGKNVLVSGHGNTLRALMKELDNVADDKIHEVEIGTAEVVMYEIDDAGKVLTVQRFNSGNKA